MQFVILILLLMFVSNVISTGFILQNLLEKTTKGINTFLTLEDSHVSPPEMIRQENFPSETHYITTEDGYILTIFRIPGSSNSPTVFLQHGLLESSADWLILGRGKSLAYILWENGYDVWLGNARGNTYSRRHQNLSTSDSQFWNFSIDVILKCAIFFYIWEELGRFDLPAVITYITNLKQQIFYIGHSMGGTTFSVMAIERPDVAERVTAAILLAPGTYGYHARDFMKLLVAPFWKIFEMITKSLGIYDLSSHNRVFDYFAKYICSNTLLKIFCKIPLFLIAGFDPDELDDFLLPKIWQAFPAGTSTKLFIHFLQQMNVNEFRKFDYGPLTNVKVYKSSDPPLFDLSKVRVPVAVFWSANDWLVGPEDVERFYNELPLKLGLFKVQDTKFNHFDFLWAIDAPQLVYAKVIEIMKSYNAY